MKPINNNNFVLILFLPFFCLLMLSLSSCRSVSIVLANTAARLGEYKVQKNIQFGKLPEHKLDLYLPPKSEKLKPVILFFYGGSWVAGEKEIYPFVGDALTSKGFIGVIPDYRLYPKVNFPEFVHDAAQALAWTHTHIKEWGGDPEQIYLMGHSAGAHIATLLHLDEYYLYQVGGDQRWIKATIGLAGPYDWLPFTSESDKKVFAPPSQYPLSQPINFVDGTEPPLLLLYGNQDTTVGPHNIKNLSAKVKAAHGQVKTIFYDLDHVEIVAVLSRLIQSKAPVLEDIIQFIESLPQQ